MENTNMYELSIFTEKLNFGTDTNFKNNIYYAMEYLETKLNDLKDLDITLFGGLLMQFNFNYVGDSTMLLGEKICHMLTQYFMGHGIFQDADNEADKFFIALDLVQVN